MDKLINDEWIIDDKVVALETVSYKTKSDGKFEWGAAGLEGTMTNESSPMASTDNPQGLEAGRYHLFAAVNCPWAHRTLLYRNVKKLDGIISLSLVAPVRTGQGWVFKPNGRRYADTLFNLSSLHELYSKAQPDYTGRVTVPVLWDKQLNTIVSNESVEIIRMFNSAFNGITEDKQDFYPMALRAEIDELNDYISNNINNGVYKAGFARTQDAYAEAVTRVFEALETIEKRLQQSRYLLGETITESDWRLFPTLVRFDDSYYSAFKCNLRAIRDYPALSTYLNDLYSQPGVAETVDLDVYRAGYHAKSSLRNPHGIVPVGMQNVFAVGY